MDLMDKLTILADAAKYDAACTSSGVERRHKAGAVGNATSRGCCHTFSADGRCVTLLKVLFSNVCAYDCAYCVNRRSNDVPRCSFTPVELCELTMGFYRRNYIEGLFLSSAVIQNPDYTMELMLKAIRMLRRDYHFNGYIHAKAIPGCDRRLVWELGLLVDRMSVNIELPSETSLNKLCPDKGKAPILNNMAQIRDGIIQSKSELALYKHAPQFAPAGQSTQMIVGATGENDLHILKLTQGLYRRYGLRRVFFSAYMPVGSSPLLPALQNGYQPPLLREHRLYQADWLLRFYRFSAEELLDDLHPNFDPNLDPKCCWALNHPDFFPVEVNQADYEALLRVPGVGVTSARRILMARRHSKLNFDHLKKLGVVLKRAQYFLTCGGKAPEGLRTRWDALPARLTALDTARLRSDALQLSLFDQKGA